jgi:hypothetical protein
MKFKLMVPILYLVFNRLDSVKKTFPEIQKAKPRQLFVACDGPRTREEKVKTDAVRKYILDNITWKCEIKTLFRDKNFGCKLAVSGAIDWFFENVGKGIILEDDCLPNQSFFRFCEEMLEKYSGRGEIMSVSGYNYLGKLDIKESYYFSRYFECWGWATWKRAWEKCDIQMGDYQEDKKHRRLSKIMSWVLERIIYKKRFEDNLSGRLNSWAYCFLYSHFKSGGLSITPRSSLVKNIGLSKDSTHTSENKVDINYYDVGQRGLKFPLIHPQKISPDEKLSRKYIYKEIKRLFFKLVSWK